jgi:putative intracellular protease/amidase
VFTAVLVATSCAALPGTDRRTGIALPQFGLAHDMLTCSGWRVVTTSPAGGAVPVDAGSWSEEWAAVTDPLSASVPLQDLDDTDVDAWVVLGGHGALFDLPGEPRLARLLTHAVLHQPPRQS